MSNEAAVKLNLVPPITPLPDRLFKVVDELLAADRDKTLNALFSFLVCEVGADGVIERAKQTTHPAPPRDRSGTTILTWTGTGYRVRMAPGPCPYCGREKRPCDVTCDDAGAAQICGFCHRDIWQLELL